MAYDKNGCLLMQGDKVRIILRCRRFRPSLKVYTLQGVQDSIFVNMPRCLLSNGKYYYGFNLVKVEE